MIVFSIIPHPPHKNIIIYSQSPQSYKFFLSFCSNTYLIYDYNKSLGMDYYNLTSDYTANHLVNCSAIPQTDNLQDNLAYLW